MRCAQGEPLRLAHSPFAGQGIKLNPAPFAFSGRDLMAAQLHSCTQRAMRDAGSCAAALRQRRRLAGAPELALTRYSVKDACSLTTSARSACSSRYRAAHQYVANQGRDALVRPQGLRFSQPTFPAFKLRPHE